MQRSQVAKGRLFRGVLMIGRSLIAFALVVIPLAGSALSVEETSAISQKKLPVVSLSTNPVRWPQPPDQITAAPSADSAGKLKLKAQEPRVISEEPASKLAAGMIMDAPSTILPEVTTTVKLSSSDLNRIVCMDGDIKEALTSDEKGVMIKTVGKDAYVKFKVMKRGDGSLSYSTTPTEFYFVCGGNTFSMIAFPSRLPSQTLKLSTGVADKIKENQSLYSGLPFEKKIMRAIKEIYTDTLPDSYTVTRANTVDQSWKAINIALRKEVDIEGEGMHIKEYQVVLKDGQKEPFKMTEKMFLKKEFAINPVAISIDKHTLRPGDVSRVFIVEQRAERQLGGGGLVLPSIEGGKISVPSQTGGQKNHQPLPTLPPSNPPKQGASTSLSSSAGGV